MPTRSASGLPTINDVAREAGVSRATASRVLGGYGPASARARAQVGAAAAKLRYRPNTLARGIRSGRTRTLGLVISDIQLSFFSQVVRVIADTAHEAGFEVILMNTDEDLIAERAAVGVLADKRVDGILIALADPTDTAHLEEVQERGIPVVYFDRSPMDPDHDAVVVDNVGAARAAVDHLVALGHTRVAIVVEGRTAPSAAELIEGSLTPENGMTSPLRLFGWAAALRISGLPVLEDLILRSRYERADARRVSAQALRLPSPPTAIVTTDETMTLGVLEAVRDLGLEIPSDVSLVSFDHLPWTTIFEPPMTVVAQPVQEIGGTAARRLLRRIEDASLPPETIVLRTSIELRGSTGPVPAKSVTRG